MKTPAIPTPAAAPDRSGDVRDRRRGHRVDRRPRRGPARALHPGHLHPPRRDRGHLSGRRHPPEPAGRQVAVDLVHVRPRAVPRRRHRARAPAHPRRPDVAPVPRPRPHHDSGVPVAASRGLLGIVPPATPRPRQRDRHRARRRGGRARGARARLAVRGQPDRARARAAVRAPDPRHLPDALGLPRRDLREPGVQRGHRRDHREQLPRRRRCVGVLVGDVVYMLVETHAMHVPTTIVDVPYALRRTCS